jgi:transcriptional regulator with XRE-family HTH domain
MPKKIEPCYELIGKRIARLRMQKGLTQTELANAITSHRSNVSQIEKGRQRLQLHNVGDVAHFLRIAPEKLIAGIFKR